MIILALLLAASTPVGLPPECLSHWWTFDGPRDEMAMCDLAMPGLYPELVRFRNVRLAGEYVCGEINQPWGKRMSGFYAFAYRDKQNWMTRTSDGLTGRLDNRYDGSWKYKKLIAEAVRDGNPLAKQVETQRKLKFEGAAREFMTACNQAP